MDTSKIIKGVVSNGRYTVTAPIVKEDYGLYLKIEGVELPSTYEVDFSNSESSGTSVTMIGNSDGVLIPHQFIDTGKDVFAFLYHVGDNYGKTVYKFRIPNKVRPDRTNEEPTPEEQSLIDQAIGALNTAVAKTAQDVIDAGASAQSASQSAENAHDSAVDAQNYAESAQASANNASASASQASASATASAQSASQSAQIKADVEDLVDDAQGYAQESELSASQSANSASQAQGYAQSASQSANSASQAQGYAQSASASAQSASGYASQADISANTASAKAQDASQSATTASQKATEASQSASQALTYKTDAESAKTASQTAQGLAESARDTAVQAKTDAESARDEAQNLVDGISGKVEQIDQNTADIASLEDDRYKPYVTDTASGSIASFTDGADDIPLKSLVVDINPIQDLRGQDSPYPAGGGKNLIIPPEYTATTPTLCLDLGADTEFSAITLQFKATDAVVLYNNAAIIDFRKDDETHQYVTLAEFYNENGVRFTPDTVLNGTFSSTKTNVTFRQAYIYYEYNSFSKFQSDCLTEWQLAVGSTPTDYAPYENICPISGWTETIVAHAGSNLWNPVPNGMAKWNPSIGEQIPSLTTNFTTFANDVLSVNTNWAWNGNAFITNKLLTGRTYKVTGIVNSNSNRARIGVYTLDAKGCVVRIVKYVTDNGNMDASVTMGASDVRICVSVANATDNEAVTITNPCISESGIYEPYNGQSITINLGQTVYGGKLDVLSGELTVDRAMVDLGTLSNWRYNVGSTGAFDTQGALTPLAKSNTKCICSQYKTLDYPNLGNITNSDFCVAINKKDDGTAYTGAYVVETLIVKDSRYSDVEAFKTAMSGVMLCYELAEPIEIQLSANQINSLYGVNNIWADSGDCTAEYRADTKAYIAKKIAEALASLT